MKNNKYKYFKIANTFLNLTQKALSQKALKLYILHCRAANKKKNENCSLTGFAFTNKVIGIADKKTFIAAMDELISKNLVAIRDDVSTGKLKSKAVEVLNFPGYDKKRKHFIKQDESKIIENSIEVGDYINIPIEIVDEGYLKKLDSKGLFALLKLYSFLDVETGYVNVKSIHLLEQWKKSKVNRPYDEYIYEDEDDSGDGLDNFSIVGEINKDDLDQLINCGLIRICKVSIYKDPEDASYCFVDKGKDPEEIEEYQIQGKDCRGYSVVYAIKLRYLVSENFTNTLKNDELN